MKRSTSFKLCAITIVNWLIIAASSPLAVFGDGTVGALYWVLGLGSAWVFCFALLATVVARSGNEERAVKISAMTLPLALLIAIVATTLTIALGLDKP